jgi:Bacteriophage tail sheath protein
VLDLTRGTFGLARRVTDVVVQQGRGRLEGDWSEPGRIWAARLQREAEDAWKYVNLRRYILSLELSIEQGLEWTVFEPNGEELWARVRQSVEDRLSSEWRTGKLLGTKAEEAYFVRCDRTTMTQDDIDNGRLVVLVGVAPVRPAEFVNLRIGSWAAAAVDDDGDDGGGDED